MSKIQDFVGKKNLFFGSLPISPWAIFATWLHLEAPSKNTEKINKYWLSNIELVLTHTILELGMLGIGEKLFMPSITLYKKVLKNLRFTTHRLPKTQSTQFGLIGTLKVNADFKTPE